MLFGCNESKNENPDVDENIGTMEMGQESEEGRKAKRELIDSAKRKSGYSDNNKESYLLSINGGTPNAILPNTVYVESIGGGTLYCDKDTNECFDSEVKEAIAVVKDYNTHKVLKEIDVKKIVDEYDGKYFIGNPDAYNVINEDNNIYVSFTGYEKVDNDKINPIILSINIETNELVINEFYKYGLSKYKENLGYLEVTNFQDINNLNYFYIDGYNSYWSIDTYSDTCRVRISVDDLNENILSKLYERFPTLSEDMSGVTSGSLTLYLETNEADILSIFGNANAYNYEGIELYATYSKSGKDEVINSREEILEKINDYQWINE